MNPFVPRASALSGLVLALGLAASVPALAAGGEATEKPMTTIERLQYPFNTVRGWVIGLFGGATATDSYGGQKVAIAHGGGSGAGHGGDAGGNGGHGTAHWSYSGGGAPAKWGQLSPAFAACAKGLQQSPIDIETEGGVLPAQLKTLALDWSTLPLNALNNGHTIQVNAAAGSSAVVNDRHYQLAQFHFHHPSEHTVDGAPYPMEAHFVHMSSDGSRAAVIGVFIEEGAENAELAKIWRIMPSQSGEVVAEATIDPNKLLPADLSYFNYAGSLTTPPCSEIIDWVVLKQPITASKEQIETFSGLFPGNARPIQELNRRKILASR